MLVSSTKQIDQVEDFEKIDVKPVDELDQNNEPINMDDVQTFTDVKVEERISLREDMRRHWKDYLRVLFFSLGFSLVVVMYETDEQYYTKYYGKSAFVQLCILYSVFAVVTAFVPLQIRVLGLRILLVTVPIVYPIFIFITMIRVDVVVYIMSVILGVAASTLWTIKGVYITAFEDGNEGVLMSIFGSTYILTMLLADLIVGLIKELTNIDHIFIKLGLGLIAILGCLILAVTPNIQAGANSCKTMGLTLDYGTTSFWHTLVGSVTILKKKRMLGLVIYFIQDGYTEAFFSAFFTEVVGRDDDRYISRCMPFYGVFASLFSVFWGYVFDRIGFKTSVVINLIATATVHTLFYVIYTKGLLWSYGLYIIITIAFSIHDSRITNFVESSTGKYFKKNSDNAFACALFFEMTSRAIFSALLGYMTVGASTIVPVLLSVLAAMAFLVSHMIE
jgi:hypothetical protein